MSDLEEKLKKPETDPNSKARCWLKKHLTLKNGSLDCLVLESDKYGPVVVETGRMGIKTRWRRILIEKGDSLFEVSNE